MSDLTDFMKDDDDEMMFSTKKSSGLTSVAVGRGKRG